MASLLHFVSEKALIGKIDQVRIFFTMLTRRTRHSLAYRRLTTREIHRPACSRHINPCPAFVLQKTCSMHMHAHIHVTVISRHNSRLHSIHNHEQERDDMIYTSTCSHQGKLRRPLPPALTRQMSQRGNPRAVHLSPHLLLRSGPQTSHNGLDKHLSKSKCRSVC